MHSSFVKPTATPPPPAIDAQAMRPTSDQLAPDELDRQRWRVWFIVFCFGLLTCLVLARLLDYHLIQWSASLGNAGLHQELPARGVIVDRDGELLAAEHYFYRVAATPSNLSSEGTRLQIAKTLETLLGLPANETLRILTEQADRHFAQLAKAITLEQGQLLLDFKAKEETEVGVSSLQDVYLTPLPVRFYPQTALASHIIGFVPLAGKGAYGLEEYYDSFLSAASGVGLLERSTTPLDSLEPGVRRFIPSVADKDLILTLDRTIQWILEDELRNGVEKYRAQGGTIIVMTPKTGAILGMASWPNYDPNRYGEGKVSFERFSDPAISALYEPGSIFKVMTMAAALDIGVTTPTTIFNDTGSIIVGDRTIYNSDRLAAGPVNATVALAKSLNVVTAQIADQVGSEQFYRYVRRFGFGDLTEVDLADEVPGLLKVPGNELWSLSDLGTNSFGQGLAVTPIQMVNAVAAIANGGVLMRPYIVQARVHNGQVLDTQPTMIHRVLKPESAKALTEMMVDVVNIGNSAANVSGYRIAGKSGTAQIPTRGGYLEDEVIASFVGFAPADDPQFVILVKLDRPDPQITQWANYNAAPLFAQVARRLFDHLNIAPDAVRLARND
ncbi:MAG: penicillin-binding protein 2 [Chloroflexota bacterium]|nr:penicillin-binding protein 2 [Chloroflexota bacterium]